ncbi:MAG TPA: hypothetical protein VNJ70_04965 [Thermoanaerobaculia bacterium]|nr:hypothetical protein [Thermoanaerobaculia bacterium]
MHSPKLARVSALALVLLFLCSLSAFAAAPCSCNFCQRHPEKNCVFNSASTTCAEFLIVTICPPLPPAASTDDLSAEEVFFASISEPTQEAVQEPSGCLIPTN